MYPQVVKVPANVLDVDTPVKSHPATAKKTTKTRQNRSSYFTLYFPFVKKSHNSHNYGLTVRICVNWQLKSS